MHMKCPVTYSGKCDRKVEHMIVDLFNAALSPKTGKLSLRFAQHVISVEARAVKYALCSQ